MGRGALGSVPRRTSSCSLVSSRATAAGRGPRPPRPRAAWRPAAAPIRTGPASPDRGQLVQHAPASGPGLGGRKPWNRKRSVGRPAAIRPPRPPRRRDRDDADPLLRRLAHQLEAGVGDERRAGVARQRHRRPRAQPGQHARPDRGRVVLVVGLEAAAPDAEMAQQPAGHPGVLAQRPGRRSARHATARRVRSSRLPIGVATSRARGRVYRRRGFR